MTKETQAWIKELENNFQYKNHNRGDLIRYKQSGDFDLEYNSGDDTIFINGLFTIEELEALIDHMKKYQHGK